MLFASVLICICFLGYLAQSTGLCMVRGVNEWKAGNKEFLLAILFSGILIWVAALFSHLAEFPVHFRTYPISIWLIFGGFIFGLGTAFNGSCGVSTLSRLTRGDSKMTATILGWLVGWTLLAYCSVNLNLVRSSSPIHINYLLLIIGSLVITIWALWGDKERKKLWFGMMGIGLLSGFIYLYQPKWPPSALFNHLSSALINQPNNWPLLEQYIYFVSLLIGMFLAAWRSKRFLFVPANIKHWVAHLLAGILMGTGASLAMGGNSVQLLLALPILSPAGFGAIAGMLLGIWSGLYARQYFKAIFH
ncbi:YeeE/YedE thiosulfate transporter family protein [Paraglaciecola sp.]|uniref:YeeE/YedE thiosulfate transporter family protein n=1 Tax=Paraglaciecola sp. TaxID=1920173 RepID=UPI003262D0AA